MADSRNPNRRVAFPERGEGHYLRLSNSGIRTLFNDIGADWFTEVEKALHWFRIDIIEKMLGLMVFDGDGKPVKTSLDDLPDDLPMSALCDKLMDAYCLAMNGRTWQEQLQWLKDQGDKLRDEQNPPMSSVISTTESSDSPTGQA